MAISTEALDTLREGFVGDAFGMQTRCPICSATSDRLDAATNISPQKPLAFDLRVCRTCEHSWIDPLPTQPFLNHLYGIGSHSIVGEHWRSVLKQQFSIPEQMVIEDAAGKAPGRYLEIGVG